MNVSAWARSSTCGPMTIPSSSSITTTGSASRGAISPASTAASDRHGDDGQEGAGVYLDSAAQRICISALSPTTNRCALGSAGPRAILTFLPIRLASTR